MKVKKLESDIMDNTVTYMVTTECPDVIESSIIKDDDENELLELVTLENEHKFQVRVRRSERLNELAITTLSVYETSLVYWLGSISIKDAINVLLSKISND